MNKEAAFELINKEDKIKSIIKNICRAYCFELYNEHKKAKNTYCDILSTLDIKKCSVFHCSFLLFALSEHARINKDRSIIDDNIGLINEMTDILIEHSYKEESNIFGKNSDRVNTSTLGMIYGALLTMNNYLKRDMLSRKVKDIKKFVFDNNISKGTLVNGNKCRQVSVDIIFSVVPFGMFSPEDLVMVEAIKEIEGIFAESEALDSVSVLLLSWYYAEKGNYNRAKALLNEGLSTGISTIYEAGLYLIISKKLQLSGEIGDNKIIHKPYGNYNRYEPQIYERFPKEPLKGEKVIINAVTWPIDSTMEVYLNYKVNNLESTEKKGQFQNLGSEEFWQWEIGPFNELEQVEYYIYIKDKSLHRSDIFKFNVLSRNYIRSVQGIKYEAGVININGLDKYNKKCPSMILVPKENGILDISTGINENEKKSSNLKLEIKEEKSIFKAYWETSCVEIQKEPLIITLYNNEKALLKTSNKGISWYEDKAGNISKIEFNFKAQENEKYYGFGERYNHINQKGNCPDVYVYNQYKEQGIKTYMPIPFFISSKGYGIYINSDSYVKYDMEKQSTGNYSFTIEDNNAVYSIIPGTPKKIIEEFTNITGKPKMLPKWAFGPWMSSNNWDSDTEVRKQVELTKKYRIPATVLVIEAWSDEATYYIFNDAVYEENDGSCGIKYEDFRFPQWGRWPDPKGLVEYLHNNELKCILWQIPIIKYMNGLHHLQKDADEEYMINKEYYVKDENNKPYRMPEGWFKDSILMDFSNPEGAQWWFNKRKYLVEDVKADGFKTDGGEFVFGDNIEFYNGKNGKSMRNLYPNDYVEAYYNFINKLNPNGGITFSRAGFAGAQKFPAHWAGDERSNFKAFRSSIIAGLNSGISGISFWGWDLAGFSGEIPTAELYIRAAQMAAFCPIMQYHAESRAEFNQDRTPWNIWERTGDIRALDYYKFYADLRMNILPYIYMEALKSSTTGVPVMKALFVEYPDDELCLSIADEYLFGDSMLVAPVVEEGAEGRKVYLPEGRWIDFWDNKLYEGKTEINISCGLEKIPVFLKAGSILPLNLNNNLKLGGNISNNTDSYENLCFRVYGKLINHYKFIDDLGNSISLSIINNSLQVASSLTVDHYYLILDTDMNNITDKEYKTVSKIIDDKGRIIIRLEKNN